MAKIEDVVMDLDSDSSDPPTVSSATLSPSSPLPPEELPGIYSDAAWHPKVEPFEESQETRAQTMSPSSSSLASGERADPSESDG